MSFFKPSPEKKALKLEKKGDSLFIRTKYRQALAQYQKSEALNPDRKEIYEKMIKALEPLKEEWNQEDFSNSMSWTMIVQEFENPSVRFTHERLTPEYEEIKKTIQSMVTAADENAELEIIEKVMEYGEMAVLPALDMLLSLKKFSQNAP